MVWSLHLSLALCPAVDTVLFAFDVRRPRSFVLGITVPGMAVGTANLPGVGTDTRLEDSAATAAEATPVEVVRLDGLLGGARVEMYQATSLKIPTCKGDHSSTLITVTNTSRSDMN
jgi:hypothetical protein